MAIPRKKEKNYHVCEFCKIQPCAYMIRGEVEFKTHCRSYIADTRKIASDKKKRPRSFALQALGVGNI